jgi:hypothetical protein
VHTGVKSAGWLNKMVHLPSRNLWKSRSPWVVFAWKLGAGRIVNHASFTLLYIISYQQSPVSSVAARLGVRGRDEAAGRHWDAGSEVLGVLLSRERGMLRGEGRKTCWSMWKLNVLLEGITKL